MTFGAAAQSPFSAAAIAKTKLAPAVFNSAATVCHPVVPACLLDSEILIPYLDPELIHKGLQFFEGSLCFIPATLFDRFACRAHECKRTLRILKESSRHLASLAAV